MSYTPTTWADSPATTSPIDAANLNHLEGGVASALQSDGSVTSTAAQPVSQTLSGSSKVMADWNATDGHHYQIRELSDATLEIFDATSAVSLMRWGGGKVWITPHTAFGSTAALALTIGDSDTGINWAADGHITIYSQNTAMIDIFGGTTVNVLGTLESNGVQVPSMNGGGSKISVQSSAPGSPAVGDIWIDTSISL
jgi:hypothetical protein